MVRAATADDGANASGPNAVLPRRFQVRSSVIIGRAPSIVWSEIAQLDHPAWSDHPSGEGPGKPVGEDRGLVVGAAHVSVIPPVGATGVRGVLYTEIKDVEPGHLVATESVVTGAFKQAETVRLLEHPDGGTLVEVSAWVNTVPITEARADRLQHNLQRIQSGYLERARSWNPQSGYRPNVISPEADDLPNLR